MQKGENKLSDEAIPKLAQSFFDIRSRDGPVAQDKSRLCGRLHSKSRERLNLYARIGCAASDGVDFIDSCVAGDGSNMQSHGRRHNLKMISEFVG